MMDIRTNTLHVPITFTLALQSKEANLTTHQNPLSTTLLDMLKKPLADGRMAKLLSAKELEDLRKVTSDLIFLLPILSHPFEGYKYELKREPTPPPAPAPIPELIPTPVPQTTIPKHALPARPDFVFGAPTPSLPIQEQAVNRPVQPSLQKPIGMSTGLVKRPLENAIPFSPTPESDYGVLVQPESAPPIKKQKTEATLPVVEGRKLPQYVRLDPQAELLPQLANQRVIEWPVVQVLLPSVYEQRLSRREIQIVKDWVAEGQAKAARIEAEAAKVEAIFGAYGSDSDEEDAEVAMKLLS